MVQMIAQVTAVSNATADIIDTFMEIGTTTGTIKIKRVRVGFGGAGVTAVSIITS